MNEALSRPRIISNPVCTLWVSLALCVFISCTQESAVEAEIRIGFLPVLSGELTAFGEAHQRGADLAVREVNEAGGLAVGGRRHRVVLLTEDAPAIPEVAMRNAQKLINQEDVIALVGPFPSSAALPVAALAEQARIPMISPTASNPKLTAGRDFVFRGTYQDDQQSQAMARFAFEHLGARTAGVLYDVAGTYNESLATYFREAFEAEGGQVVAFETYTTGEQDHTLHLTRIRTQNPDVLFLPNFIGDVRRQAEQARAMGLTATFLGSDSWVRQTFTGLEALEGAFYCEHWHPENAKENAPSFFEAYQQTYSMPPNSRAALTYDAFGLLFEAITQQGVLDEVAIREGLANITNYEGVTGKISYQDGGDPLKSVVIVQVQEGQPAFFQQIDP